MLVFVEWRVLFLYSKYYIWRSSVLLLNLHYYFCQLKYIQEFQREKEAFEKNMARFKLVSMFQYKNTLHMYVRFLLVIQSEASIVFREDHPD